MTFTKEQAEWMVDGLISATTLCTKLDSMEDCADLRIEADETYEHIRSMLIDALSHDDKNVLTFRSDTTIKPPYTVTC